MAVLGPPEAAPRTNSPEQVSSVPLGPVRAVGLAFSAWGFVLAASSLLKPGPASPPRSSVSVQFPLRPTTLRGRSTGVTALGHSTVDGPTGPSSGTLGEGSGCRGGPSDLHLLRWLLACPFQCPPQAPALSPRGAWPHCSSSDSSLQTPSARPVSSSLLSRAQPGNSIRRGDRGGWGHAPLVVLGLA